VPLEILLPMVVIGIICIVLLIHWMRPTPEFRLEDRKQVADIWAHRNPENTASTIHLNGARSHALIETAQGFGLVWVFGADPVTRLLDQPFELEASGSGLRILTHDFTAPRVDIVLDTAEITRWSDILRPKL